MIVSGRVQGVAFRAFTQQEALRYNLHGWVRNLFDGNVELEVEGGRATVDLFFESLRQGPPLAHVDQMNVKWITATNEDETFCIVR